MSRLFPFASCLVPASTSFRLALSCALSSVFAASLARGALIASESFKVGTGAYSANTNLGSGSNASVVTGNFGFASTSGKLWTNSTAGAVANASGLSHPFLAGTAETGGVRVGNLTAGISRRVYRPFAATPPAADTYYFSGLVNLPTATGLDGVSQSFAGLTTSSGTTVDTFNIASGIHYGLIRNSSNEIYLSVAANNTVYPLFQVTGTGTTFQVVLRLDVSTSGNESLSAWYAPSSASELSVGLTSVNVGDIYSAPTSIGATLIQTRNQSSINNTGKTVQFDELRFGTAWADVTTAAIPEPARASFLFGASAALCALRRRRRISNPSDNSLGKRTRAGEVEGAFGRTAAPGVVGHAAGKRRETQVSCEFFC
jgi:hypothetical protein